MQSLMRGLHAEVHQRLGHAAFKMASRFHARSVAQPHGALQLTKLMKAGEEEEESRFYSWRRIAFMDVLIDGAACVRKESANAATVDGAVPLRQVVTHTVSSHDERQASYKCKVMMIIRSIEVGLACNHPNWICCGDYNGNENATPGATSSLPASSSAARRRTCCHASLYLLG